VSGRAPCGRFWSLSSPLLIHGRMTNSECFDSLGLNFSIWELGTQTLLKRCATSGLG
jgi:hypothetical protein